MTSQTPEQRDPNVMKLADAARMAGVTPSTLRRWIAKGAVRVFRSPGQYYLWVDVRDCYPQQVLKATDPPDCAK